MRAIKSFHHSIVSFLILIAVAFGLNVSPIRSQALTVTFTVNDIFDDADTNAGDGVGPGSLITGSPGITIEGVNALRFEEVGSEQPLVVEIGPNDDNGNRLDDILKPSEDILFSTSPCGSGFDFSIGGCCNAIKFNNVLIFISNILTGLDLESETLDSLLGECAETLTDICSDVRANECPS